MEQKRFYPDMSPEQQLQWVTDFEALMTGGGNRIVEQARSRSPQFAADDAPLVRRIVSLLAAWPFAADFCDKAQRYGDYMARTSRLPVYVDKVKERLADGLTMTDAEGRTVAYVSPSAPMRRRGRPSAAEVAARLRGEALVAPAADTPETLKRRRIAALLGLQVIVHGDAPREKNNAELAADRAAKQREYERQNPSLFGNDNASSDGSATSPSGYVVTAQEVANPAKAVEGGGDDRTSVAAEAVSAGVEHAAVPQQPLACPTMSEVYQDRIDQDRLRLSDLAWLCSDDLRKRIETVRALRVTAESASERAKTMADMGAAAKDIEPYAQQAKEAVEGYLAIYAAVDEELAIQFKRLSIDLPYIDRFKQRFRGVDVEKVLHITRPYYEKVKKDDPAIDARVKLAIETDNPEYAAKMKADEAKKEEIYDILRYLKRKDKPASDVRLKSAKEVKFPRLVELIGEEEAKNYYPLIAYIEEENRKLHEKDTSGTGTSVPSADAGTAQQEPVPAASAAASKQPAKPKPEKKSTAKKPSKKK